MSARSLILLSAVFALGACKDAEDSDLDDTSGGGDTDTSGGDEGGGGDDTSDSGGSTPDVCQELGLTATPWQDGVEQDATLQALAGDLSLATRGGDFVLSEQWSGCETYLFLQEEPRQAGGYDYGTWDRDHKTLLQKLPANAHVFFISSQRAEAQREAALDAHAEEVEKWLERLYSGDELEWRRDRIHYVTDQDTKLDGWLGEHMQSPGWGTAVDRFQRVRYIGSYADYSRYDSSVGWFEPNLGMAANEAIYYNFEAERQAALDADGATVLPIFTGDQGSATVEVELPEQSVLDGADTLTLDLTMECIGEGEYGTCPAWDYMAYLYMCDEPDSTDNPYADTACEAGDTQEGSCTTPLGEDNTGTYSCNEDGTGYDDLSCACNTEIGRWITTYHREGRWAYDISPMLPLFSEEGTRTLRFSSSNSYELYGDLRFSNTGKSARPTHLQYLTLSESEETFSVPATATKVELATVISQHGQNSYEGGNCGEFCDAEHSFTFNGDTGSTYTRSFSDAGSSEGCMDQVAEGTVPNQYGTWWYGRAGWCPGKEVPTVAEDITSQVSIGGENTVLYEVDDTSAAGTVRRRYWILSSE